MRNAGAAFSPSPLASRAPRCTLQTVGTGRGEERFFASLRMTTKSELAGFLAGPALYYDFGFGEKFHGVPALAVEDAEETFFPAAEGEIGHGSGDADVDADVAGGGFVAEATGGGAVGGEERGLVAVGAAAEEVHGFVHGIGVDEAEDGAENFCVGELAGGREAVENGGSKEAAGFVIGNFCVAAIEDGFGAFADAGVDERF